MAIKTKVSGSVRNIKNIFASVDGNAKRIRKVFVGDSEGRAKLVYEDYDEVIVFTGNYGNNSENRITSAIYNPTDKTVLLTGNFTNAYSLSELKYIRETNTASITSRSFSLGSTAEASLYPRLLNNKNIKYDGLKLQRPIMLFSSVSKGVVYIKIVDVKNLEYFSGVYNPEEKDYKTKYQTHTTEFSGLGLSIEAYSSISAYGSDKIFAGRTSLNGNLVVSYRQSYDSQPAKSLNLSEYKSDVTNGHGQTCTDVGVLYLNAIKTSDSLPYMLKIKKIYEPNISIELNRSTKIPLADGISSVPYIVLGQGCTIKNPDGVNPGYLYVSVVSYKGNDNKSYGQLNVNWNPSFNNEAPEEISIFSQVEDGTAPYVYSYRLFYLLGVQQDKESYVYILSALDSTFKILKFELKADKTIKKVAEYDTKVKIESTTRVFTPTPRVFSSENEGQCPAFMTNENGQYKKFVIVPLSVIK